MRTIVIETVSNGYIVTQQGDCQSYVHKAMAVFNRMTDLQKALPDLLFSDNKLIRPPQSVTPGGDRLPETVSGWPWLAPKPEGGDRLPETIGGNERCPSA